MPPPSPYAHELRVAALVEQLAHTGKLVDAAVAIPGSDITVAVTRPADTDRLLDQIAADPEQNLPYWAEIWPSGIALAAAIVTHPERVRGRRVLELGCGVGITAAIALAHGARLTVTDYAAESLVLARLTCLRHTGREPERAERVNWRDPASLRALTREGRYDVVLGADLLYEQRDVEPLLAALDPLLAPGGALWLAEPGRRPARAFLDILRARGWRAISARHDGPWPDSDDAGVIVETHWLEPHLDNSLRRVQKERSES
jgi:predicted nicotinamide N-methyase